MLKREDKGEIIYCYDMDSLLEYREEYLQKQYTMNEVHRIVNSRDSICIGVAPTGRSIILFCSNKDYTR